MSSQLNFFKPTLHKSKKINYKNNNYPIDFGILRRYSAYFTEKRQEFKHCEEINFIKDDFDVSNESFENFISFCQMRQYEINHSNVFDLYLLSFKFGVQELGQETHNYITQNHQDLIFQSISFKNEMMNQKNDKIIRNLNLQKEKEILFKHFFEYIDDERLLDLSVQFLYNIIKRFDINKLEQSQQTKMIDFLFICLNHYKKEASVLFLNLDIESQRIEVLTRLQSMKQFDFFMLNPKFFMKSINDLLSEMSLLKDEYSNLTKEHEMQCRNDEQKCKEFAEAHEAEITKIEEKYQKIFTDKEERIKNLEDKYNQLVQSHNEQVQEIKKIVVDEMKNLKQYFEDVVEKQNKIFEEQKNTIHSIQQDIYICQYYKKIESFEYQSGKEFDGIMRNMCKKTGERIYENNTIEITSNSIWSPNYDPKFVVDYDTSNYYCSRNDSDIYILFNFKDKFVKLSKYSLMSGSNWNEDFLKNWVIEVSNDGICWIEIDRHENESSLRGGNNISTFTIKQNVADFYRYIKLRQIGNSWYNNSTGFYFGIYMIEFFGSIKEFPFRLSSFQKP